MAFSETFLASTAKKAKGKTVESLELGSASFRMPTGEQVEIVFIKNIVLSDKTQYPYMAPTFDEITL